MVSYVVLSFTGEFFSLSNVPVPNAATAAPYATHCKKAGMDKVRKINMQHDM